MLYPSSEWTHIGEDQIEPNGSSLIVKTVQKKLQDKPAQREKV